mgnify:CR=1 FL=1
MALHSRTTVQDDSMFGEERAHKSGGARRFVINDQVGNSLSSFRHIFRL